MHYIAKTIGTMLLFAGILITANSCKKKHDPPDLPTLSTTEVSSISSTTADSGGEITSDGGGSITERGVCWSNTLQNPTVDDNHTSDGTGSGTFNSTLTGLSPGTTYYVRSYATNAAGTAYGELQSFITFVFDADGNSYNTVTIGSQIWLKENLKTTKLNDGTAIPNVTGDSDWAVLTTAGYCWYNNNTSNKNVYGALYNWFAVSTGKLCPSGWHVPTDAEWTALTAILGGETVAGNKLKETGTVHWAGPNTEANDEYGFSALPGGYRNFDGVFNGITGNANWRSATQYDEGFAWYRYIMYSSGSLYKDFGNKEGGFSVRCLMD